jgi:hypothetical protein
VLATRFDFGYGHHDDGSAIWSDFDCVRPGDGCYVHANGFDDGHDGASHFDGDDHVNESANDGS